MAKSDRSWKRFQSLRTRGAGFSKRARRVEAATTRHARRFVLERWKNAREVRRNIGIWLLGVGVLIAAVAVQFLLLRGTYTEQAPVADGTYAEGVYGKISTLNPLYATTPAELSASRLLFSSLFNYDTSGTLNSDIATDYKVDKSGKVYTVTLREDARWHDGKPVTADDVVFTVGLLKKPSTGSSLTASWQDVSVKKVSPTKVTFTLPASYAPFPHALTFAILPEHLLKDIPPNMLREHAYSQEPVGSGPFSYRFLQKVQGDDGYLVLHMARNDNYYEGAPKLSRMQLHVYEDREALAAGLRNQSINAASGVALSSMALLKDDKRFDTQVYPVNAGVYALFNTTSEYLKDKEIRQALNIGTDVDQALKALPWTPQRISGPFAARQIKDDDSKPTTVNVNKAKKMLNDAGWKVGKDEIRYKDKHPLRLRVAYIKDADYEAVIANIAKQWRSLGVDVDTHPVDTSDPTQNLASTILQPRDYDVLVHELLIGADPDVYAYWHSSQAVARGLNFTNFNDPVSDDALSSARSRREPELRDIKYKSFARRWHAEVPAIGLYQSVATYVSTKGTVATNEDANLITATDRFANAQYWTVRSDAVYKTP